MTDDVRTRGFRVEMVTEPGGRVRRVHTAGLWFAGLPELVVDPPRALRSLGFFLACALVALGHELLEAEHLTIEPVHDLLNGEPVRLWLDRPEAPDDDLVARLGGEVDTVIRVRCSLWDS